MIGLAADMPTPSLGTQSGADGAVGSGSTAFSAASGRFSAADTGATITIIDTGATVPTSYTFTVTYVSGTALTLSSAWAGTGTSALSWLVTGRGPSNAGLMYYATDGTDVPTGSLYESDGASWHTLAGPGGGSGIQFNFVNEGGWLYIIANAANPYSGSLGGYGVAIASSVGGMVWENVSDPGDMVFNNFGGETTKMLFQNSTNGGIEMDNNGDGDWNLKNNGSGQFLIEQAGGGQITINNAAGGNVLIEDIGSGNVTLKVVSGGYIILTGLPTSSAGVPSGGLYTTAGAVFQAP